MKKGICPATNKPCTTGFCIEDVCNIKEVQKHDPIKTGIELIAIEREEQIWKHGRTIELDVLQNSERQLVHAARMLLAGAIERENGCPKGWDQNIYNKMANKSTFERIIIAAALLAAESDRIQAIQTIKPTI